MAVQSLPLAQMWMLIVRAELVHVWMLIVHAEMSSAHRVHFLEIAAPQRVHLLS